LSYYAPLIFEQNGEMTGFLTLYTNLGPVIILAEEGPRFNEFLDLAVMVWETRGEKVGTVDLNATSFAEAVRNMWEIDRKKELADRLPPDTVFIEDSDPILDDIVRYLRREISQRYP
jgi:hypothetical protein